VSRPCSIDTNTSGIGADAVPTLVVSATTPTISDGGACSGLSPMRIRVPTGDRPSKYFETNASFTTAIRGVPRRSRSSKVRPARSAMPSASK
jgi:hypothetical protein